MALVNVGRNSREMAMCEFSSRNLCLCGREGDCIVVAVRRFWWIRYVMRDVEIERASFEECGVLRKGIAKKVKKKQGPD